MKPGDPPADDLSEGIHSLGDLLTQRQRKRFKAGDMLAGRYRVIGELGQGGMGVVFRCLDTVGGVERAVKMLPPEVSHDSGEMEEVRENFQLVARLSHPNIAAVRTLERDPATGEYLLVMDCAPGVNLRQWRKGEGRRQQAGGRTDPGMALEEAVPVLRQIAAALDYAHEQKVIHRDIKPSNVMVSVSPGSPAPQVRLLDFGLAAQIHTSFSRVSQVKYGTSGTGPYMAPEQWRGEYQDAATDQYALGVMAYELLAGRLPFESHDPAVLKQAVLDHAPVRPAGLADPAWNALRRALVKMRDGRFPTCTAFVDALAGTASPRPRVPPARRSRRALAIVCGVAGLAAVLAAGAWWQHTRRGPAAGDPPPVSAPQETRGGELDRAVAEALARGDTGGAARLADELAQVDPARAAARRGDIAQQERKSRALAAYGEARRRGEEDVPAWEREPDGVQPLLRAFRSAWDAGERARLDGDWALALRHYEESLAAAERLDAAIAARAPARAARTRADAARGAAEQAGAAASASAVWDDAERARADAEARFGQADFVPAAAAFDDATRRYQEARDRSTAVQAYRAARSAYDTAFAAADHAALGRVGGAAWDESGRLASEAAGLAGDPARGRPLYERALAKLQEAQRAEPQARAGADLADALGRAREAAARGAWSEVLTHATTALNIDPTQADARAWKDRAAAQMAPTLTVIARAGGQAVAATVSDGAKTWPAGQPIPLKAGQGYDLTVTYASADRRWQAARVRGTASWAGARTESVTLDEATEPGPDDVRQVDLGGGIAMDFVWIPAGTFRMGSPATEAGRQRTEGPQHGVTLSAGFWMGRCEVTQAQWKQLMRSNPSAFKGDRNPVDSVTWPQAKAFCAKLQSVLPEAWRGRTARLPTEAEWEYACRAGTTTPFHYGGSLDASLANVDGRVPYGAGRRGEYRGKTVPVGSFGPNPWGLFDMHGNVWEWCADGGRVYDERPQADPQGTVRTPCLRGGSWFRGALTVCRSAYRYPYDPAASRATIGFRVVVR